MVLNKKIICKDGFSMSVQAHEGAYCEPRTDSAAKYVAAEVGYPSEPEPLFIQWAESPEQPCNTVYGWVPAHVVTAVCAKHGGVVSGELPAGIPYLSAEDK